MTTERELAGVILAAGRGTRMAQISQRCPKPLLPILNQPLIRHHVAYMRSIGVTKVYVVIGYLGYQIALDLESANLGVELEFVEQLQPLGIAHALMQLEPYLHDQFVMTLGDIYFEIVPENVNPFQILDQHKADGVLAIIDEPDPRMVQRNFEVRVNADGVVERVIEKPRFPRSRCKGCGVYVFNASIFDAIRRTPRSAARDEYELTDAIQIYVDDGAKIMTAPVVKQDVNLTFGYDLLTANLNALRGTGEKNLIHPEANVHPDAKLEECIIGAGAKILHPIDLRHVVAMPGATIDSPESHDRFVATQDTIVDCRFWIDRSGTSRKDPGEQRA
jgi:NDP-sugar pyrophosphorylase family protein